MTDDSSSSSSDDESDEKKSSKDSTAEAKTDIKKEPSPPAAAETPKTEISEYFISVYIIFYLVHNLNVARNDLTRNWKLFSYFDLLFEKCKTKSVFHFFQILFTYNLSIDHTSSWYTWVFYVLYRPERIFIKLSTDGATCDAYSFKLGSKKTIHMLCAQIPTVGPRSIRFHNNLSI